jgi:predicted MFS family arabinose efflux permease
VIGGLLTETIGWRSIFWINVPIGVAAFVLAAIYVPESRAERPRRTDPIGQVLVIVLLFSLTYAIISGPRLGWGSVSVWAIFAVFAVAVVALLRYEPRRTDPLLDLRFFRSTPFAGATLIAICAFSSFSGFLFLNTLYLQDVRHLSALQAGLFTLPLAAMTLICAPLSGRIVGSRGPRRPLLLAGVAMALGALALTGWSEHSNYYYLVGAYIVFGIGFGTVNAPITNTAVSGMPREQAGVAAAIASTSRQIGASLGVAVVGSVAASGVSSSVADGFTDATRPAWWIITGLGVAVLLLGLASSGARARESARQAAARLAEPATDRGTTAEHV